MVESLSLILSFLATAVASGAFMRTLVRGTPSVELLVENDKGAGTICYNLTVSNPTRRLIVLDEIVVNSHKPVSGFVDRQWGLETYIDRALEDDERAEPKTRSVYCAVRPDEIKCLEIVFKGNVDDEKFDVDFRFVWSKGLPWPDRWLMPRRIRLDASQVESRKKAAGVLGAD